jgi:NAD+ diphosphatase
MEYKFCPKCSGELEEVFDNGHLRLKCSKCAFIFYQNSKPCVSAVIFDKDKILLGKRADEPAKGDWDIVGGFLEPGEHPEDGLRREVKEETGLEITELKLLGMFMDKYPVYNYDTLNIAYLCKVEGTPKADDDVADLKWFRLNEIPQNLAFKNTKDTIDALKNYLKNHNGN